MDSKIMAIGVALIVQCGGIVWWASSLSARVTILQNDVLTNSTFVRDWPLGRMGALPDDTKQNEGIRFHTLRINRIEQELDRIARRLDDAAD